MISKCLIHLSILQTNLQIKKKDLYLNINKKSQTVKNSVLCINKKEFYVFLIKL